MPSWNDLLSELEAQPTDEAKSAWLKAKQDEALASVAARRSDRNVLFYASAFLQKPQLPGQNLQITHEEINGFMSTIYGMTWSKICPPPHPNGPPTKHSIVPPEHSVTLGPLPPGILLLEKSAGDREILHEEREGTPAGRGQHGRLVGTPSPG